MRDLNGEKIIKIISIYQNVITLVKLHYMDQFNFLINYN